MKNLKKNVEKIMIIASWKHLSKQEREKKIEEVLSNAYDLGHCDGYAEGIRDGYKAGFQDGW